VAVINGVELALTRLAWSTTAPATSPAVNVHRRFNITLSGNAADFSAFLQRSFDAGATWSLCTAWGAPVVWTQNITEVADEPELGVLYRVVVSAIASGTLFVRISQ
jgi:hypothetical protein